MLKNKRWRAGIWIVGLAVMLRILIAVDAEAQILRLFSAIGQNAPLLEQALSSQLTPGALQSETPLSLIPSVEEDEQPLSVWTFSPPVAQSGKEEFPIEAISINPRSPGGYVTHGNIYLKNDSSKKIDLKQFLEAPLPFTLTGAGPHVLIIHTHGSESYFPEGKDTYTPDDVERTSDKNYNVVRVGNEIAAILKARGIHVVHDTNLYDSPTYNGSYTRALKGITRALTAYPNIQVVLDIHRDAMTAQDGVKYKTLATVNGESAAQLMLVMSTGESGLSHPNWQENLKLGVKLQGRLADKYPGLMRPINLRKDRFNMHATKGSLLVEVGTSANSLSEALTAVRPLAEELAGILKEVKR